MGTISNETRPAYAVKCLICGDSVGTYHTAPIYYAVCLNCKKAVLHVREQMEREARETKSEDSQCLERSNQTDGDWVVRSREPL